MRAFVVGATLMLALSPAGAQEMQIVRFPEIGVENTIPAGGEIYSFARVYSIDGAVLDDEAQTGLLFTKSRVPKGTKLVPVSSKAKFKACVPYDGTFEARGPCYLDDDGDGLFDRNAEDEVAMAVKSKPSTPYSRTKLSVVRQDSFKTVLLYQGATADTLRFSYREFKDDVARPAFTEELSIPREPYPAMIMVKNVQLEVAAVTGMGLKYKVVKVN
ncbi:hypothetical protein ACKU27_03020 [Sphingobium yanoikuyae]|uniref:hypothetical protein n=1 Tax=Sphingobium yanoikuyae TaxID=13690 RepID=UPI003B9085E4